MWRILKSRCWRRRVRGVDADLGLSTGGGWWSGRWLAGCSDVTAGARDAHLLRVAAVATYQRRRVISVSHRGASNYVTETMCTPVAANGIWGNDVAEGELSCRHKSAWNWYDRLCEWSRNNCVSSFTDYLIAVVRRLRLECILLQATVSRTIMITK